MNIIKYAFLVMAVVDVFVIFLMICAEAISTIRRKFFKKDEKKNLCELDFDDDDILSVLEEPEPVFDKDFIKEHPFDDDVENIVSDVIFPKFKPMLSVMTKAETEDVDLLLTSIILYLKEEALYEEQSFPMVRYLLENIEPDTSGEFKCPVEMLMDEAAQRNDTEPLYLTLFKEVKQNSADFKRTVHFSIRLMDKVIRRLYREYFRTHRDFDSSGVDAEIMLAGLNFDIDDYFLKDEVE